MLYFAYGSNMNLDQMAKRSPHATPLGQLILPDTRLVFRGVADVVREEGAECPGVLWRITADCEMRLDRYEGYDPEYPERGMYAKEYVAVDGLPDGETEVMLYTMNSTGIFPPSQYYFNGIKAGYKAFDLPLAPLWEALSQSYDDKRPSHVERRRFRRMGRPALAARKVARPQAPAPAYAAAPVEPRKRKHDKRQGKLFTNHDPWADVPPAEHRRKLMNLDQWLKDRRDSGRSF